ncbi:NAD-dependent epimerase/dehydratase family protein [Herbaspirillum sp. NPDC101396]|uniref:NAD-dependent epimerase/dehydratase family protein n=1 Tax=Herbaspirillum sp. NPDC101396 TaxID=3364005 RepID=UPI00383B39A8
MNVLIFGATGMVGQGLLRECLRDPAITTVQVVGRTPVGVQHPKLKELLVPDLFRYDAVEEQLRGFDACFFCLGVSAGGKSEAEYTRITYDLTMAAAQTLCRLNPQMSFSYVSGAGTDSTERGSVMWARVKGKTENALLALPFKAAHMFRPGAIQPMHGEVSKTPAYRWFYLLAGPLLSLLRGMFPRHITTTEQLGRAMINVLKRGQASGIIHNADIAALA